MSIDNNYEELTQEEKFEVLESIYREDLLEDAYERYLRDPQEESLI